MSRRGWALKGYRPEASKITTELRGRRSGPVKKGNTLDAEIRLCALYVTQPEMSMRALAALFRMRLGRVREILEGWGVDPDTRDLLPWPPTSQGKETCDEMEHQADSAV
jgi:hypothetical protein